MSHRGAPGVRSLRKFLCTPTVAPLCLFKIDVEPTFIVNYHTLLFLEAKISHDRWVFSRFTSFHHVETSLAVFTHNSWRHIVEWHQLLLLNSAPRNRRTRTLVGSKLDWRPYLTRVWYNRPISTWQSATFRLLENSWNKCVKPEETNQQPHNPETLLHSNKLIGICLVRQTFSWNLQLDIRLVSREYLSLSPLL